MTARSTSTPVLERRRIIVTGTVQGVGFRPFVYRLANRLHLTGSVTNVSSRVVIEAAGTPELLDRFQQLLIDDAPPLAVIESLIADVAADAGATTGASTGPTHGFVIADSESGSLERVSVPPDTAPCPACSAEFDDPANRRYRHPFITCTDCGPRFTIITGLPYDRPATTMAGFDLCPACHEEYHDPDDRRFHAQPIACHDCGPTLRFDSRSGSAGVAVRSTDPIQAAARVLTAGGVVVVKGVGGFQLACDAGNTEAVAGLRKWKQRPDKPLALLVADVAAARDLVELSVAEEELLTAPARPIVLAPRRVEAVVVGDEVDAGDRVAVCQSVAVCDLVAPDQPRLGVMLPSTPLHVLLARAAGRPLVLTSGNRSGSPMCHRDEQLEELLVGSGALTVGVLTHDRPIAVPCDDSVVRVSDHGITVIRRARGYAPTSVDLEAAGPAVLATGGQLKNTFCLTGPTQGWVGPHVGDMDDLDTLEAFGAGVDRFERFYDVDVEAVIVDAHPDYSTRSWVRRRRPTLPVVEIQHHHAHIGSVLAEHGVGFDDPVIGVAFDGTGYGLGADGGPAVWGGEFLAVTGSRFRRIGHLAPLPMPGGDLAVINPYRVALAFLHHAGVDPAGLAPDRQAEPEERAVLTRQLETGFGCLPNSSMGRLFDAVSSIIGLRHRITYEAQGAIELELAALRCRSEIVPRYRFDVDERADGDGLPVDVADPRPLIRSIVDDLDGGRTIEEIALGFHRAVVELIVAVCRTNADDLGTGLVALSGGVFQNALLLDESIAALRAAGFEPLTNRLVPPNDGGLALGQAYLGRHHLLVSNTRRPSGDPSCA